MSLQALVWAFEQEVTSSSQKFVLVALANFASETGLAYPAVATICQLTQQKDETVRKALAVLVADKVIEDTGKKFGPTQQVKVYKFPSEACKYQRPPKTGTLSEAEGGKTPPKTPPKTPEMGGRTIEPLNPKEGDGEPATPDGSPKSQKRELTDGWCSAYEQHHRRAYKFEGAKDGKAADRLLTLKLTVVDILGIAKRAWQHPDWFNCKQAATLSGFECRYNDIRHELDNPPKPPAPRPGQPQQRSPHEPMVLRNGNL